MSKLVGHKKKKVFEIASAGSTRNRGSSERTVVREGGGKDIYAEEGANRAVWLGVVFGDRLGKEKVP